MQYFTIFQDKLHSFNTQDHRSTRGLNTVQKMSKVTYTASMTNSRGSRVAGRGSKVVVAGPMSRSRVQSRGRGSNLAAGENDLGFEVTAE